MGTRLPSPTVSERRRTAGSGSAAEVASCSVYQSLSIVPVGALTPPGGPWPVSERSTGPATPSTPCSIRSSPSTWRLGFRLDEIKRIAALKKSGRTPCAHVLNLVHLKLENIEQALTDLAEVRGQLQGLLRS
jgi:hypothetical protein